MFKPTPPGFPAPVTTGAGGSRTAPRPCGGALPRAGPNDLGFRRAPCGLPQSAGSAPSTGPESSPFPWLPGGRNREHKRGDGRGGGSGRGEGKWRMTNEEEEEDGVQRGALTIMMSARERVTERQREGYICSTSSSADRKNACTQLPDKAQWSGLLKADCF